MRRSTCLSILMHPSWHVYGKECTTNAAVALRTLSASCTRCEMLLCTRVFCDTASCRASAWDVKQALHCDVYSIGCQAGCEGGNSKKQPLNSSDNCSKHAEPMRRLREPHLQIWTQQKLPVFGSCVLDEQCKIWRQLRYSTLNSKHTTRTETADKHAQRSMETGVEVTP
jgi:hypothetical protein